MKFPKVILWTGSVIVLATLSSVWAEQPSRGIEVKSRVLALMTGVSGSSSILSHDGKTIHTPSLQQKFYTNDQITTGSQSTVELLIHDSNALLGIGENTTLVLEKSEPTHKIILHLKQGHIKIALGTNLSSAEGILLETGKATAKMTKGLAYISVPSEASQTERALGATGETPSPPEEIFLIQEGDLSITIRDRTDSTILAKAHDVVRVGTKIRMDSHEEIITRGFEFPLWATKHHATTPHESLERLLREETQQAQDLAHTLVEKDEENQDAKIDVILWRASLRLKNGQYPGLVSDPEAANQLKPFNAMHARLFNFAGGDTKLEAGVQATEPHEPTPYFNVIHDLFENFTIPQVGSPQVFNPSTISTTLPTPVIPFRNIPLQGNLAGFVTGPGSSPPENLKTINQFNTIAK